MITGLALVIYLAVSVAVACGAIFTLVYVVPLLVIDEVTEVLDRRRDRQLAAARAAAVPPPPGPAPDLRAPDRLAA